MLVRKIGRIIVAVCALSFVSSSLCYASTSDFIQDTRSNIITGDTPLPDLFTGALGYAIPIKLPVGRNGMAPDLVLHYSSRNGNGPLGVGWELEAGSIERSTRHGVNFSADEYVYRRNGGASELVKLNSGNNEYRQLIEGEFNRIQKLTSSGPYWVMTNKAGVTYRFGYTQASRQYDAANPDNIFKWCLDQVQDPNGNTIIFNYFKHEGQIYLEDIQYTSNGASAAGNYVKFYREGNRIDTPDMFTAGFEVRTAYRIKSIDVVANADRTPTRVRAYKLGYNIAPNAIVNPSDSITGRSLLTSITEYGSDAAIDSNGNVTAGTSLPPITLSYQSVDSNLQSTGNAWTLNNWPLDMATMVPVGKVILGGDYNGDGRSDLARYSGLNVGTQWNVAISTGSEWNFQNWTGPVTTEPYGAKCAAGDFNSDGKTGVACYDSGSKLWTITSFTGSGWTVGNGAGLTPNVPLGNQCVAGDINGNGKTDVACYDASNSAAPWRYMEFSRDQGTLAVNPFSSPQPSAPFGNQCIAGDFTGSGSSVIACYTGSNGVWKVGQETWSGFGPIGLISSECMTGDFNGDRLTDLACYDSGFNFWVVAYSTGRGWSVARVGGPSVSSADQCIVGDFNGDGISDLACYTGNGGNWDMAFSLGNRWGILYNIAGPVLIQPNPARWPSPPPARDQCIAGDFNGDGKSDLACYTCNQGYWVYGVDLNDRPNHIFACFAGGQPVCGNWTLALPDVFSTDLLSSISNGIGSKIDIHYTPSTTWNNTQLPFPIQTVSSIETDDGNGNVSKTDYAYSGGYYHVAEHEFRGFNRVTVRGPEGPSGRTITDTWFHQGKDTAFDANDPSVSDGYMKGKPYRERVTDGSGNKYTEVTTSYATDDAAPYFNPPVQVNSYLYDGGTTAKQTKILYTYDNYGNIIREDQHGDLSNSLDDRTIVRTFSPNTADWIVGLPAKEETYKGIGTTTKVSGKTFYYDDLTDCSATPTNNQTPIKGNLTRVVSLLDGGTSPESRTAYDSYGNPVCARDANGYVTRIGYDSSFTFPKTVTNALGHQTVTQYYGIDSMPADKGLYGQAKSVTDPNGAVTGYQYDVFGRQARVTRPDGFWTSWAYNNFGTVGSQNVRIDTSAGLWSADYFDGPGRTYKTKSSGPDSKTIITETEYDTRGLVTKSSLPYFEGIDSQRYTTYTYDPMGRVTKVTKYDTLTGGVEPAWRTLSCYNQGVTVTIDPNNHRKRETRDVYDRLVKVEEYRGTYTACTTAVDAPYATTIYQYDVLGNLRYVTDAKGNVTEMHYDTLGRKDYMIDPDMGKWGYTYDGNGNLKTQTDAKGQVIRFNYDALNRPTLKDYPTGTDVTFKYDEPTSTYGKGRLTRMIDASGVTNYFYDNLGRTILILKSTGEEGFAISAAYDGLDRIKSITYPDNETVTYSYDTGGNLYKVGNYATYTNYNAHGQPGKVTFGNGATTNYSYFPANNRLSTIKTATPSQGTLLDLGYSYDKGGNIRSITDSVRDSVAPKFTGQSYSLYPGKAHAFGVTGKNFQYDANGSMTSDGQRTITYNFENMPNKITIGGQSVSFVYDGNGRRVKKIAPTYTRLHIDKWYECTGADCVKYIFAGDTRIAYKSATHTRYYHPDHLGSTSIVTDETGKVEDITYDPFGKISSDTGTARVSHLFTSQELDAETALYNYIARLYDPETGRFVTPDSIVPDYTNPQSLNRYAYALDNPLGHVDPTGHEPQSSSLGQIDSSLLGGTFTWDFGNWADNVLINIPYDWDYLGFDFGLSIYSQSSVADFSWPDLGEILWSNFKGLKDAPKEIFQELVDAFWWPTKHPDKVCLFLLGGELSFGKYALGSRSLVPYEAWPSQGWNQGGFLGGFRQAETANVGQTLSRIGSLEGSYVSPLGTTLSQRGLPSTYANPTETLWEVVKPFNMQGGIAAPWKDATGLGVQYRLEYSIQRLWDRGFIRPYYPK